MNVMLVLQKAIGVFAASTFCAAVIAFLDWAPCYADTTSGFLGTARDWAGVAAIRGAVVGCVLGAVIGVVVVLSGAGQFTGALVGTLALVPVVAIWLHGMSHGLAYDVSYWLMVPAGAVAGAVASLAPSWASSARLSSSPLSATALALLLSAPLILLFTFSGVKVIKVLITRHVHRKHLETVAMLDNARVEVSAKNAKVISDDGEHVLAEVTLEIDNVPLSIPFYELNIHKAGEADSYFVGFYRSSMGREPNPYLRVTNADGKWVFHDTDANQTVSDDARNVTLRFEFKREKASPDELPDTITPRLGIWARDDKVYSETYIFFYKPIPVSFSHGLERADSVR